MSKSGKSFELLIKAIYEEILALDGYEKIEVKHDANIVGKSGQSHQIDIYWEFKLAGVNHCVAIECKDYKNSVSVGRLRDFYGALEDIGNIQGIFVTTKGYQAGAITYAKHKNISLKTVKVPTDDEVNSHQSFETLMLNGKELLIDDAQMHLDLDVQWILDNTNLKEGEELELSGSTGDIKVVDSNFNLKGTILDFENQLPREPENKTGLNYKFEFTDSFIHVPGCKYPLLKINGIKFTYNTFTYSTRSEHTFKLMAEYILKDIVTGDSHLFNKSVAEL